jgi:peptidoglycan/xylan/chitin deacetylase (PgdA/CDA1 family)
MILPLTYHRFTLIFQCLSLVLAIAGCRTTGSALPSSASPARIEAESRFLLTFDDGPAVGPSPCSTVTVLERLRNNSVQPSVKAIFFVQTRAPKHGGCEEGLRLMRREHAEEHILGLHSGTVRGHLNHTTMKPAELQQSLVDGVDDIAGISGRSPLFVRPTFWRYNADTLARYEKNGLSMILSDVKAYDGGSWVLHFNSTFSSQRHGSMLSELQRVHARVSRGELPVVNGIIPIIVTFHDTNAFTANHLEEYMQILVEEARRAGLRLSSKPFYDDRTELETAAQKRAEHHVIQETRLPARLSRFFKGS